jgi:protein-S-isoprenylcysteine O-methyltransferase Ste14
MREHPLEHRIPPPVVALLLGLAMWGVAAVTPALALQNAWLLALAVVIGVAGIGFSTAGALAFRRASTTVNPLRPETASTLVSSGVYRITRNPMYVGLAFGLVSWALFLASAAALAGPLLFMAFIQRFQIVPEERALNLRFGSVYADYCRQVRRWL